jgi:hypothetical protein
MFKVPSSDSSDSEVETRPVKNKWLKETEKPKEAEKHSEKTCYHKIKYLEKRIRQLEFLILNKK